MADKTVVVRAVYRSNVAQGMRQDAGAMASVSASVEQSAARTVNSTKALGAASAVAGKLMILGIGGALAVSAKAAIDFESSMAGVAKTTDLAGVSFDRNSGPLFQFGEALRSLALRTPINVNELASIAELGGRLGIQVPNLIDFTEVMAELGVTTNLSAEEAASGFARFANIMRTPQSEFRRLGSIVVELGNNLATTESEILRFATRIAPVGRAVGATEEDVFALASALSSLGIPAERGGTAVQKWMIRAKRAVDEGGESLDQFSRVVGMTSEEFQQLFRESPGRAFAAFAQGLDDINERGGNLFGTLDSLQLSEVRTTQVLLAAAGGTDVLTEALDRAGEQGREVNALHEEAARRFGTTESKIRLVANAFTDLRIEVGNAVLGTGGLAFALDVMKEFFGIIGDNLGILRNLALVMGGLVVLRVGLFFLQAAKSAQDAIQSFRGVTAATAAMSGTARAAQGGMLLLTGAMQGALGIAGLLAAAWTFMAINAAQAKAEAKALREEIERGADPLELFSEKISDAISQRQLDFLHDMGFGVRDLAQFLMDGRPAASELGQALADIGVGRQFTEMGQEVMGVSAELLTAEDLLNTAGESVDNFFKNRTNELRNALIESGNAAELTNDQIDALAEKGIREFGFDISDDEFLQFISTATGRFPALEDAARSSFGGVRVQLEETEQSWQQFLREVDPENATDTIEGFSERNIDAVQEFREKMDDEFNRIGETIRSGFPVWGEYEQVILGVGDTLSGREVLRAQEKFLEDTGDFVSRLPDILQMGASAETVKWLEDLEAPIRGAIGRLNDAQLQELIDGANANFDALHTLHLERWMQIYPESANLAFGAMIGELAGQVNEIFPIGEHAMEAFGDGLLEMAATLPEQHREEFIGFLTDLLNNEQAMFDLGFDSVDQGWIEGLIAGLLGMSGKVAPTITEEARKIKNKWSSEFRSESPSKWFEESGEGMVEGLKIGVSGMADVFSNFDPNRLMPEMVPGSGAMSSITNNRNANFNLTVNSGGNGQNIRAEAQTLLTLLTIVGGVESGAGR